jgi:hypothetical protein
VVAERVDSQAVFNFANWLGHCEKPFVVAVSIRWNVGQVADGVLGFDWNVVGHSTSAVRVKATAASCSSTVVPGINLTGVGCWPAFAFEA